ncbi:MAG: L-aspartate oxidase [Ignavibacteriaceae bacterium]|nr:L-aspartate oxidase [Ignavibacteriaceae bacterium]
MATETDVLIIGSGIAGLFTALQCSEFADVILVTKKGSSDSNTNYAQGGIASVFGKEDTFDKHISDTLIAGAGLCDRNSVEMMVREGPDRILELIEIGTQFTYKDGSLHLAKEGGHSASRIVHAKDLTGKEVERSLLEKIAQTPSIRMVENSFAIDLITEHHVYGSTGKNSNCFGAYVHDPVSGKISIIRSKFTLLATGGLGQIYLHTTNPEIATGDGYAMAYRAGARIANMEFVQFHPTSLYEPDGTRKKNYAFLISEAVRGHGALLRNKNGRLFMSDYDSRKELAPRDIVARAIDAELKKHGDDFVYIDMTHFPKSDITEHFPNIYKKCLELGIDASTDYIPVVPAAHYSCGGIVVDKNSRSSLNRLYAVGEVTMTGVHGANRLASNSLLEALIFGKHAALDIKSRMTETVSNEVIPEWDDSDTITSDEKVLISHAVKELKLLMWNYVGIVRSDLRLQYADRRIMNLLQEVSEIYRRTKVFSGLLELRNLIQTASLIVKGAQMRKESRGLHYNINYPGSPKEQGEYTIQSKFENVI